MSTFGEESKYLLDEILLMKKYGEEWSKTKGWSGCETCVGAAASEADKVSVEGVDRCGNLYEVKLCRMK